MRLVVDRKTLAKTVDLALLASGRGAKDAALANVLITARSVGSTVTMATVESYDIHLYSKASCPIVSGEAGSFAIDGTRLVHLISAADEGNVEFTVDMNGAEVTFGRAKINLRTFPVDKYVHMTTNGIRQVASGIRAQLLLNAIEFVRPFVGKDTQKPSQMSAELRGKRFMAGDGTRIGVARVESFEFGLRIPNQVMSAVTRWLKDASGCGAVEDEAKLINVSETEDFYFLSTDGDLEMLAWRKPEHSFAAIEPFLEKFESKEAKPIRFKVDKESFERMVGSLSVVLEAGAERVGFNLDEKEEPYLIGSALDSRGVESNNQIRVVVENRDGNNGFSLRYTHLLETLKLCINPVVSCSVYKDKSIMQILEASPEMQRIALLTLMLDQ